MKRTSARFFLNQPARIVVDSFQGQEIYWEGHQDFLLSAREDNVTTFEVRVSISNPGGELKANMSANAEIMLEEKKNVLMIPERR